MRTSLYLLQNLDENAGNDGFDYYDSILVEAPSLELALSYRPSNPMTMSESHWPLERSFIAAVKIGDGLTEIGDNNRNVTMIIGSFNAS